MSINRPESGEPLTSDSIRIMHTTVRSKINDVKDDNLGRSSIGPQHLSTTPEENLPQNNTTFVVDHSIGTAAASTLLTKGITVYVSGGGSNKGLANVNATQLLAEVTTNWHLIATLNVNETLIADTDKSYRLIIRFDSLIDSNKFIKSTANNATSQAETDRHGGVQQSVSNTSCVELNRTINGGVLIQHKINNIKLYAAYTTGSATSYNFSGTHTLKPKLNNNTLQYYILQQPTNPS